MTQKKGEDMVRARHQDHFTKCMEIPKRRVCAVFDGQRTCRFSRFVRPCRPISLSSLQPMLHSPRSTMHDASFCQCTAQNISGSVGVFPSCAQGTAPVNTSIRWGIDWALLVSLCTSRPVNPGWWWWLPTSEGHTISSIILSSRVTLYESGVHLVCDHAHMQ